MSDIPDPLEAELTSLRPLEPSADLYQRIGAHLENAGRKNQWRTWRLVVAGGLAAACLTAAFFWWGSRPLEQEHAKKLPQPNPQQPQPQPVPAIVVQGPAPTLLACQQALAHSPEELEALLDRYALAATGPSPAAEPIHAFVRSEETLHTFLGAN